MNGYVQSKFGKHNSIIMIGRDCITEAKIKTVYSKIVLCCVCMWNAHRSCVMALWAKPKNKMHQKLVDHHRV